jgi:acyl-homoserine-lactone acylase
VRPGGTYQDWAGILPGNTSSTLWTETLSWGQLPKTIDPPGGYVSNANEPPWFATFPRVIQQNQYPSYIAPDVSSSRPGSSHITDQLPFFQAKLKIAARPRWFETHAKAQIHLTPK